MSEARERSIVLDGASVLVRVPIRLRRRRGRREIIAPAGQREEAAPTLQRNASLALTIARAHRWRDLLEAGSYRSIRDLALELQVDNSYAARLLRLTLLAPDIVDGVLTGTEPDGLSLEKLYRAPSDWGRQRQAIGLAGSR